MLEKEINGVTRFKGIGQHIGEGLIFFAGKGIAEVEGSVPGNRQASKLSVVVDKSGTKAATGVCTLNCLQGVMVMDVSGDKIKLMPDFGIGVFAGATGELSFDWEVTEEGVTATYSGRVKFPDL